MYIVCFSEALNADPLISSNLQKNNVPHSTLDQKWANLCSLIATASRPSGSFFRQLSKMNGKSHCSAVNSRPLFVIEYEELSMKYGDVKCPMFAASAKASGQRASRPEPHSTEVEVQAKMDSSFDFLKNLKLKSEECLSTFAI